MFLLHILVFKEFAELFEGLYLLMLCDAHIVVMFVMTIFKKCPFLLVLTSKLYSPFLSLDLGTNTNTE